MNTKFIHHFYIKTGGQVFCTIVNNSYQYEESSILEYIFWQPYEYELFLQDFNSVDFYPISRLTYDKLNMPKNLLDIEQKLINLDESPFPEPSGACLIDIDQHRITVFEGMKNYTKLPLRRVIIRLMHLTWPNWRISWAEQGYTDILERIGYCDIKERFETSLLKLNICEQRLIWDKNILSGFFPVNHQHYYARTIEEILENLNTSPKPDQFPFSLPECIVTLKTDEWAFVDFGFNLIDPGALFSMGPKLINRLENFKPIDSFKPPVRVQETLQAPYSGIMIDVYKKHVSFWLDNFFNPLVFKELKKLWHGWYVTWHTKGLPYQYYLVGSEPQMVMMPFKQVKRPVLAYLPKNASEKKRIQNKAFPPLNELINAIKPIYSDLWKDSGENLN